MAEIAEIIRGHCPVCTGIKKAYVRAQFTKQIESDDSDPTSASDTYYVLECCGCGAMYVKNDYWFSEWDEFGSHPITDAPIMIPGIRTRYWPQPATRKIPDWISKIDQQDDVLGHLLDEMYTALNNDIAVLAAIGARTAFDRSSELLGIDPELKFHEKLTGLVNIGKIGADEKLNLDALTNAGSAAAHRGWAPSPKELGTMVDILEAFLYRAFILAGAGQRLKAIVPPKAKRAKPNEKPAKPP